MPNQPTPIPEEGEEKRDDESGERGGGEGNSGDVAES